MGVERLARPLAIVVAVASGLAVRCAPAHAEIDSVQVRAGVAAYDALDFARAVTLLESARKQRLTVEELTITLRTLGSARVALGDEKGALADFTRLFEVAPTYALDRTVSPRIRAVFEQARADVAARAPPPAPTSTPTPTPTPTPAPTPAVELRASPPPRPVYKRAWFWGVIGGVAGAAVLAGVLGGVLGRSSDGTLVVVPRR